MNCPLCQQAMMEPVVGGDDVECGGCNRIWYATGDASMPIAGRRRSVTITGPLVEGAKYTDVVRVRPTPNRDAIVAAIDSLKSGLFHLRQSNLDEEGRLGKAQIESTLMNLEKRLAALREAK